MTDSIWDSLRPKCRDDWVVLVMCLVAVVVLTLVGGQCSVRITSSPTTTTVVAS